MSVSDFRIEMPQGGIHAATVVSILPVAIEEKKPGINPGIFPIPAAEEGDFQILVVGPSHFSIDMGENRPAFKVNQHPTVLAQSIVMDYKVAHVLYIPDVAEPGLFWVPGALVKEQVASIHKAELERARQLQQAWYQKLVESADDTWAHTHQFGGITNLMRLAATALKLKRDWLIANEITASLSECPVCHTNVHPKAVICASCKFVLRPEEMAKLKDQFAI